MLVFISGNDAPGIVITVVDGKVVIKRVPGWNPEVFAEVKAAVSAFETPEASRTRRRAAASRPSRMKCCRREWARSGSTSAPNTGSSLCGPGEVGSHARRTGTVDKERLPRLQ
jgi:hypothetical protein